MRRRAGEEVRLAARGVRARDRVPNASRSDPSSTPSTARARAGTSFDWDTWRTIASTFAPSTSTGDDGRHPPLVHRGYWARTAAVRALTNAFASSVDARETFNVVNVGWVRYHRFVRVGSSREREGGETDHEAVATTRRRKTSEAETQARGARTRSSDVISGEALRRAFDELPRVFDWSAPTLVIAECVLALTAREIRRRREIFGDARGDRRLRPDRTGRRVRETDDAQRRESWPRSRAFETHRPSTARARFRQRMAPRRRLDMNETSPDSIPSSARVSASSDLTSSREDAHHVPLLRVVRRQRRRLGRISSRFQSVILR